MGKRLLYPNVYILLIGGPGVGKTDALRNTQDLWATLPDLKVAPSSVSRASLADSLNAAARSILRPQEGTFIKFNSLQVCAEEFGTFLSAYETEFMSTLNKLFDCTPYSESKRSMKESLSIPNPQLTIAAGTTPAWLSNTLPESAWSEGFSSRLIMIFCQEIVKVRLFEIIHQDEALLADLEYDLKAIHAMYGQMMIEPSVSEAIQAWYMLNGPPIPEHPKLAHYLPRRPLHLMKLCTILSAARSNEYIIRMEDYQEALDMLLEAETYMPDIFKSMTYNSDTNVIDETFSFLWQAYSKEGKGISEHRIIHFISQRAPSYSVEKILNIMIQSGIITVDSIGTGLGGRNTFKPTPKASHNR